MKTYRVVNYACNGVGMGHVTRLLAVNRALRSVLEERQIHCEFYFLTTSDADQILAAERFPAFKIPSIKTVEKSGLEYDQFKLLACNMTWKFLDLLKPDLLLVDTFPMGSFGEFSSLSGFGGMRSCKRKALIYRPVRAQVAQKNSFQAALQQYDQILVPERREVSDVDMSDSLTARTTFFGPIISCRNDEALEKSAARQELDLPLDKTVIYVSSGGGGNSKSAETLEFICDALSDAPNLHLAIAAGPLYSGPKLKASNITWLSLLGASRYLKAFDMAISAAGYNTYHELMHMGIPTVFLPLDLVADDQFARADRATQAGAAHTLKTHNASELRTYVDNMSDPSVRQTMSERASEFVPVNHAEEVALHLADFLIDDIASERLIQSSVISF